MAGLPGAGATFGRYDLTRRIGRGGMGVVYEATHRDLQRPVALKLLSMDLLDDEALRNRFIREAQALAAVDSPMIVSVFDAGEHDGWLYIATKLYPDGDLGDYIQEHGALSQDESVSVLVQVAEGLADAHEAGFLHRDIKPSNILLQRRPDGLRAVICDFGIAFAEGSEHTKTVGVIGTLGYMAPERHEGLPATAASDVYSLGCVLYACLQGRAPWVGTDVKVAMGHLYNPVPQVPEGTVAINDVLARALAKKPENRYQTAAEFREALVRLGEPEESTVIVDLTHEENLAPVVPPDLTYLLPPGSLSARRPVVDDTLVPTVAVAPETVTPPVPASKPTVPAVAAVVPVSDDTVVPRNDATVVPDAPSPTPRPSWLAWFTRRRTAWVAAAVVLVGALASIPFVVGSNQKADTSPAAQDDASRSGETRSTSSPAEATLGVPVIQAQAEDLAVRFYFTLTPPVSPGSVVQYREDGSSSWLPVVGTSEDVSTAKGGERVCIMSRAVFETDTGTRTGRTTGACGRSKPKRLSLKLSGACTNLDDPCSEVTMVATGFRASALIDFKTYMDGSIITCDGPGQGSCFAERTDAQGGATWSTEWPGGTVAAVVAEGLRASVRVPG